MNPYFLNTGVSVKSGIRAVLANTALIPLLRYPTLEPCLLYIHDIYYKIPGGSIGFGKFHEIPCIGMILLFREYFNTSLGPRQISKLDFELFKDLSILSLSLYFSLST